MFTYGNMVYTIFMIQKLGKEKKLLISHQWDLFVKTKYKEFFALLDEKNYKYTIDSDGIVVVEGYLYLYKRIDIKSLPENLIINGSLYVEGHFIFKCLPDKLIVRSDLFIINSTSFKSIP